MTSPTPDASLRAQWRLRLRRARQALGRKERARAARDLSRRLLSNRRLRQARHIAVYAALGSELSLTGFCHAARARGQQLYLPRIDGAQLNFLPWHAPRRRNRHGISEPWRGRSRPPWAMDVILLPLLGADLHGTRLGQGGGYYDRCLARLRFRRPPLIGIAYDCQIVDALPRAPWDIPLDGAITPTRTLQFGAARNGLLADENRTQ